jgi:hypothetical protein
MEKKASAEQAVREIRRKTRRRFSAEEKIRIAIEGLGGEEIYAIDAVRCTECVGFHDVEQRAAVCLVDCCVHDPDNVEDELTLFARAQVIHPDRAEHLELTAETSRFRRSQTALVRPGSRVEPPGAESPGRALRSRQRRALVPIPDSARCC